MCTVGFIYKEKKILNAESALDFHTNAGIGNANVDTMMDRGVVKTISITQVEKNKEIITMNYQDFNANIECVISLNLLDAVHE
jgi:hypothetical protein